MNVFTDFHHSGLLNSLIMLFEGRLGGNLYRPIGKDWHAEGYWAIYDHPDTANQYLTLDQGYRPKDGSPPLNLLTEVSSPNMTQKNVYYCRDIDGDQVNKAITLDTFKEMDIDIVIASIPAHIEPFKKLIAEHKPNAKLIFQIGNAWSADAYDVRNVMASATVPNVPDSLNLVSYHQEFDLRIFRKGKTYGSNVISSLINVHHDMPDYPLFLELEKVMQNWKFYSHGGQGRDEPVNGSRAVARTINNSKFIWHKKAGADGYGHIVHNAFAMGRPLIINYQEYSDKLAGLLLESDVNCINADGLNVNELKEKIEYFGQSERYTNMCRAAYRRFKEVVDFNKETVKLKEFLGNLQ